METKKFICGFAAMLVALFAISAVMAGISNNVAISDIIVNDVSVFESSSLSGSPGETVPIKVKFTSYENIEDLKVRVWIDGYKNEISTSTKRFDVLNGSTYIKTFNLKLPIVTDMDGTSETLTLHIRIADKNDETESTYSITMQKDSYEYNLLSVDAPLEASAGDTIALDVVLKNTGAQELTDSFVTATIPALGIQRKVYFGDISSVDDSDSDGKQDAKERRVYLTLPANTVTGVYELEVSASNYDASASVKKSIAITGLTASNQTVTSIDSSKTGVPNSIIVLTVVLVIVFVVLLVVLIVLLTKKPAEKMNDFGETSYY